jgi:integrase
VAELVAAGLAAKTVLNAHAVLSKALDDAMELELVARNAASRMKGLPAVIPASPRIWTAEQLASFLTATTDDRLAVLWRLLAMTGCRRGEALGLRWQDVDLTAGTVTITISGRSPRARLWRGRRRPGPGREP